MAKCVMSIDIDTKELNDLIRQFNAYLEDQDERISEIERRINSIAPIQVSFEITEPDPDAVRILNENFDDLVGE